jgi:hypothetical protein
VMPPSMNTTPPCVSQWMALVAEARTSFGPPPDL